MREFSSPSVCPSLRPFLVKKEETAVLTSFSCQLREESALLQAVCSCLKFGARNAYQRANWEDVSGNSAWHHGCKDAASKCGDHLELCACQSDTVVRSRLEA